MRIIRILLNPDVKVLDFEWKDVLQRYREYAATVWVVMLFGLMPATNAPTSRRGVRIINVSQYLSQAAPTKVQSSQSCHLASGTLYCRQGKYSVRVPPAAGDFVLVLSVGK